MPRTQRDLNASRVRRERFQQEVQKASEEIFGLLDNLNVEMFNFVPSGEDLTSLPSRLMTYAQEILHAEIKEQIERIERGNIPNAWRRSEAGFSMPHHLMQRLIRNDVSPFFKSLPSLNALPVDPSPGAATIAFLKTVVDYDAKIRSELKKGNFSTAANNLSTYAKYRALSVSFVSITFGVLAYGGTPIADEVNRSRAIESAHLECRRALNLGY